MGTAEVESALVSNPKVAEAAVVGFPHDVKGQGIYAYVTLKNGVEPGLPKTRSGKIMRRILRKIAANETDGLGDTSTLADPAVVEELVANRTGL